MRRTYHWVFGIGFGVMGLGMSVAWAGTIRGTVHTVGPQQLKDIVVFVEGVQGTFPPSPAPHTMDQKEKAYIPYVLPILKGEQVTFLNSDPMLHNVHVLLDRRTLFNLASPPGGKPITKIFDKVGELVVLCNVHPEMEAWILVRDNPFFAITDAEGHYRIEHVPAGTYTVKAWQPKLTEGTQSVSVLAEGEVTCDFRSRPK